MLDKFYRQQLIALANRVHFTLEIFHAVDIFPKKLHNACKSQIMTFAEFFDYDTSKNGLFFLCLMYMSTCALLRMCLSFSMCVCTCLSVSLCVPEEGTTALSQRIFWSNKSWHQRDTHYHPDRRHSTTLPVAPSLLVQASDLSVSLQYIQ